MDEEENRKFRRRGRTSRDGDVEIEAVEVRLRQVFLGQRMLDGA